MVLEVQPHAAWVGDQVVLDERTRTADGWTRLTFRTASLEWAVRLLMRLGVSARVVSPPELADAWRERAETVRSAYTS